MSYAEERAKLVLELRQQGIQNQDVISVMESIPREDFIPEAFREHAYENSALPIDKGQTISQPYIVGLMTQALEPDRRIKVLEIGTGSGYQTVILSRLFRRVYTVERHRELLSQAETRFSEQRRHNITAMAGDGGLGWPEQAPFDRIMVTAAAADVPPVLAGQLSLGGIMVVPVGEQRDHQELLRVQRLEDGLDVTKICDVRFVPLLPGLGES